MDMTKNASFEARIFSVGELAKALADVARDLLGGEARFDFSLHELLPDGTRNVRSALKQGDLMMVCSLRPPITMLSMRCEVASGLYFVPAVHFVEADDGFLEVTFEADGPEQLTALASATQTRLSLVPATNRRERERERAKLEGVKPLSEQLAELFERVSALERSAAVGAARLVAFVSFRFEGKARHYALSVCRFLEMLDVHVVTGESYEPRPVSEKVKGRLEGIDLVVVIVSADGPSSWLRDEMAPAQQSNVFLVPLVERGATFDPGIFGDHERIDFDSDHVGDAFLKLLEAVTYSRRMRTVASDATRTALPSGQ